MENLDFSSFLSFFVRTGPSLVFYYANGARRSLFRFTADTRCLLLLLTLCSGRTGRNRNGRFGSETLEFLLTLPEPVSKAVEARKLAYLVTALRRVRLT